MPCRFRASAHLIFGPSRLPSAHQMLIDALGVFGDLHFQVSERLYVVVMSWARGIALFFRFPAGEFHGADFLGDESRARPQIVSFLGKQLPTQHGKLAGDGHGGDLVTALRPDANEEGMQRSRSLRCRPGSFDKHCARMAATVFADAPMLSEPKPRLSHPRIEAEITHKLLRRGKASDVADRGDEASRQPDVTALVPR